jgi:hypothetical protein
MGLIHLGILLQSGLPAASQVLTPEVLLLTTLTVGCLGLAVMMLTRQRSEELAPERTPNDEKQEAAQEVQPESHTSALENQPVAVLRPETKDMTVETEPCVAPASSGSAEGAAEMDTPVPSPASEAPEGKFPEPLPAATPHRGPVLGASALIAKVACLLPAGAAAPASGTKPAAKPSRGNSGFHPAARFSRSQQAFLRMPIVLSGRDESGAEFREETSTLILLPQGAVIPMRQKVRAGDRMTLFNPARQKEVACEVFGVQSGPDGKVLVEVEFPEAHKNMWPVSFPAWAGPTSKSASAPKPAGVAAPARTPAMDSSGS